MSWNRSMLKESKILNSEFEINLMPVSNKTDVETLNFESSVT